ncbi:ATP phosphoribosyltransferase regulatory subunit [Sinobacterium caligoides]|nr:ATP phosphoribosyltransferase regulatory subunit [Sinobacterium caligoides]
MTVVDRWLLPEGVEELLPAQARQVEAIRRQLLDLYRGWGYQLVIPPLVEFTDALLIGMGRDIDVNSVKVTDELTGRMMAIRPDITAQAARIDAHSLCSDDVTRLCYAGSVLHTKPKSLMASRSPIQVGAELYGEASVAADIEVVSLMVETLHSLGIADITLDFGHVAIFRTLADQAGLSEEEETELFEVLQRKAADEIASVINRCIDDAVLGEQMLALSKLQGDVSVLHRAANLFAGAAPGIIEAIDELQRVAEKIQGRYPSLNLYFDLTELRGYHYHTGLVFGAYAPGCGYAVANGGRYDDIGRVFGRARPATGFTTELKSLLNLATSVEVDGDIIFAPYREDAEQWKQVQQLRSQNQIVICGLPEQNVNAECTHILVDDDGRWSIESID